jgi:peptide/nickel transport system substrate-binding protein
MARPEDRERLTRRTFLRGALLASGVAPALTASPAAAQPAARAALDEWVVAMSEDITTTDPLVEAGGAVRWVVSYHMFEPLVGYEGPTFEAVPRLAESWKYSSDTTLELKLRRNVKFHNGDPFTAEDVLYTYEAHRSDPKLGSGYVFDPVEKFEAVDAHTIRIVTKTPVASLLPNMAAVFLVVPKVRRTMGPEAFRRHPIGTGMYRVAKDWSRDQPVELQANDEYWGGAPSPRRLQFKFIREASTRVAELQRGTIHVAENIPLAQLPLVKRGNTDVVVMKGSRIIVHEFNLLREPFTNVKVRQAVNFAIDRDVIVKNVLQGYGLPHVGVFSPGWLGYSTDLQPYTFNPQRAKQLLAEAGHPNGFEFEWQVTEGVFQKDREIAEAVAAQLKQAGITARLRVTERATVFSNHASGNFSVVPVQWPSTVDPDRYLQWLFVRPKGVSDSKETEPIRQMMEEGRRIIDPEKRAQKYRELSKLAYERALLLFTHVQDELYGIDKRTGWSPYPIRGVAVHHWYALHPSLKR